MSENTVGRGRSTEAISQNTLWFSPAAAKAVSTDTELTQGGAAEELRQNSAWGFPLDFHGQLSLLKPGRKRQDMTLIMIHPHTGLAMDYFVHSLTWPAGPARLL